MIYLLWGLFNIGLFVFFLVVCFRATKLLRERLGLFASIVFVFGLLSFMASQGETDELHSDNNFNSGSWTFTAQDRIAPNTQLQVRAVLEKALVARYILGITYGQELGSQKTVPVQAYSDVTGLISGTAWTPVNISVSLNDEKTAFQYSVDGVVKWKLLGFTVYNQSKSYKGLASIR